MYKKLFLICSIGIASMLLAENFIVKKTKEVIVAYDDQWCDLFGQLMQLLADLDIQKSNVQKKGITEIMQAIESGHGLSFGQLPKAEQQDAVMQLRKLIDQVQRTTHAFAAYNKKMETLFVQKIKNKK